MAVSPTISAKKVNPRILVLILLELFSRRQTAERF